MLIAGKTDIAMYQVKKTGRMPSWQPPRLAKEISDQPQSRYGHASGHAANLNISLTTNLCYHSGQAGSQSVARQIPIVRFRRTTSM